MNAKQKAALSALDQLEDDVDASALGERLPKERRPLLTITIGGLEPEAAEVEPAPEDDEDEELY